MTLSIQTNLAALTAGRNLGAAGASFGQAVRRLSSGLRIDTAADDAAGGFMAAKLQAQVRGMQQASRNAQDGLSYLQTAEGGLMQMQDIVARMRELAVQASNGVYGVAERQMLQDEVDVLAEEITRIAQSTSFNGFKPLDTTNPDATPVQEAVEALRRSWLPSSERLIEKYYGLMADGASLEIFLDQPGTAGGTVAFVSGVGGADGRQYNQELHLDYADMSDFSLPNGGGNGQTIAHEMTHAVMGRATAINNLDQWFVEGTAEYIAGADNRLNVDTAGQTTTAALVAGTWDTWGGGGTSAEYSAGYAAVKYLDSKLTQAGQSMISFFDTLENTANDLDDAFAATGLYANTAAFVTEFKGGAGTAFINALNLDDADEGGIGGGTSVDAVPGMNLDTMDPLQHFKEIWPAGTPTTGFNLQIGANTSAEDRISMNSTKVSASIIAVGELDLVNNAQRAIDLTDLAVTSIASLRAAAGAAMNRLEYAVRQLGVQVENTAAQVGRIKDADVALETANLVTAQLRQQTAMSVLSQATSTPNLILGLLR